MRVSSSAADVLRLQPLVQQLYTERWRDKVARQMSKKQIAESARLLDAWKSRHE